MYDRNKRATTNPASFTADGATPRRCDNIRNPRAGVFAECASYEDVRNVLIFQRGETGEPSSSWLCARCEDELTRDGAVVARVLSRRYSASADQLEASRAQLEAEDELFPTGLIGRG